MDEKELRRQLEQLHVELSQIETPDDSERTLLIALAEDIEGVLGREDPHPHRYVGLAGRLRDAVAALESSHTGAALLMRQVIDSLSYLGV
jgi:hypothetical protein